MSSIKPMFSAPASLGHTTPDRIQNRIQLELNHFSPLLPLLPDYHGLSQYLKRS